MERNKVILVDENDSVLGEMDKIEAHKQGHLHRAFSVFIFNNKGELLLQQRAEQKYHGAGLWTNTCCSHPQPGEDVLTSAEERLNHEMGLQSTLKFSHAFVYKSEVENNLIEHEYDHVFTGYIAGEPNINKDEVQDYNWMSLSEILEDIKNSPEIYTSWFKIALPQVIIDMEKNVL